MKPKFPPVVIRFALLIGMVAICSGRLPWASQAWGGENAAVSAEGSRDRLFPPTLGVVVEVTEPESLPAASELQDWLVEHLRHDDKRFGAVLSLEPTSATGTADFLLVIHLTHLSPYDDAPRRFWRPIAVRGPDGTRALHSSQVPLQAKIMVMGRHRERVRLQTVLTVQSTGRTVTAGTTKPVAILLGEKLLGQIKHAAREGIFETP